VTNYNTHNYGGLAEPEGDGLDDDEVAGSRILSSERIRELPSLSCGVYFLFNGRQLQRIGQSTDMFGRIAAHRGDKKIPFDEVRILRCKPEDLDMLEAAYIRRYDPPFNQEIKRRRAGWRLMPRSVGQ
jgi:hypothetical protein